MYDKLFRDDLARVRELGALYDYLSKNTQSFNLSDILRTQLVFAVSAFDKLLHEIVFELVVGIFKKTKPAPKQYYDFVKGDGFNFLFHYDENNQLRFEKYIQDKLSKESLQQSHKIREMFAKFHILEGKDGIWESVAQKLSLPTNEIMKTLDLITARRNKIAHESDSQLSGNGYERNPIYPDETNTNVDFIENVGEAFIVIFKEDV